MVVRALLLLLLVVDAGDVVGVPAYLDDGCAHPGLPLTAPVIHTQAVTVQRPVVRGGPTNQDMCDSSTSDKLSRDERIN